MTTLKVVNYRYALIEAVFGNGPCHSQLAYC